MESGVAHPLSTFATNMSGRALNAAWSRSTSSCLLVVDPVRLMAAQFIYISRLPTLLNQVHAKVAFPVGKSSGIVKLYVDGSIVSAESPLLPAMFFIGQPPIIEWITLKTLLLVGFASYVMEILQEPPPCTALPMKDRGCVDPRGMLLTVVTS